MNESCFQFGVSPFYFLRHGETFANEAGIVQGQDETELSAQGRRTAERAAETLASVALGSICTSPLKRTMMTASIVALFNGAPVQALPGLMERHWGVYQGKRKDLRPSSDDPPTVETMEAFERRVLDAMRAISGPSPVLVVAHSGVFRVICRHAGIAIDRRISVANGQVLSLTPLATSGRSWHIRVV